jgi:uncharacterized protein YkwD
MRSKLPKDRRPIGVIAGLLVVVAATAGIITTIGAAHADTTSPTLRASLVHKKQWVTLHWKFDTDSKRQRDRVLEVQRSNDGGAFTTILTKNGAGRNGSITDKTPFAGPASYRARVKILGRATSAKTAPVATADTEPVVETTDWGPAIAVDPTAPEATTTTTVKATTTTTVATTPTTKPDNFGITPCPESLDAPAISLTNAERARKHVAAVTEDARLNDAANTRSEIMASTQSQTHGAGATLYYNVATAAGYRWSAIAENIWHGPNMQPSQLIPGFIASPPHEENLTNAVYTHIGMGCSRDRAGNNWWSMILAR